MGVTEPVLHLVVVVTVVYQLHAPAPVPVWSISRWISRAATENYRYGSAKMAPRDWTVVDGECWRDRRNWYSAQCDRMFCGTAQRDR